MSAAWRCDNCSAIKPVNNSNPNVVVVGTYAIDEPILLYWTKWPDGRIICPQCGGDKIGSIVTRSMLQCKDKECRKQFSVKVGTIFEDSPLLLSSWFVAVWCIGHAGYAGGGKRGLVLGRLQGNRRDQQAGQLPL